jgi:hypothetical protein
MVCTKCGIIGADARMAYEHVKSGSSLATLSG